MKQKTFIEFGASGLLFLVLAGGVIFIPVHLAHAQTITDPSCTAATTGFFTRIGCLFNLGANAVSGFFGGGNGNDLSNLSAIVPGGEVRVNRAGFESVVVASDMGNGLSPVPKGITDQEIIFQVPMEIPVGYVIRTNSRESGQFKSTDFEFVKGAGGDGDEDVVECATLGARQCVNNAEYRQCVRGQGLELKGKYIWSDSVKCEPSTFCDNGICSSLTDLSDYSPKGFGPGTPLTIVIDFDALKRKNPEMQAVGVDRLESFVIYDPNGKEAYFGGFDSSKMVQGKMLFTGKIRGPQSSGGYIPGEYSVTVVATRGNSRVTAEKALSINMPPSDCLLLYGTGNSSNLDLTFLGDTGVGVANKKDFIDLLFRKLDPYEVANFDLMHAYSNKINLWGVASPKDFGCKVEKSGALFSPLIGMDMVDCDKDRVSDAAKACPATDIMAVLTPETGGGAAARTESRAVVDKALQLGNALAWPVTIFPQLLYGEAWNQAMIPVNEMKSNFIWFENDWTDFRVFWHEMGHAFAGIIDYILLEKDCKDFPSIMCDPYSFPYFSDQKVSHDKYLMVTELNKSYCAGTIEASRPYPNPWCPLEARDIPGSCAIGGQERTLKVQVRAKYPNDPNENTCYATFEVFNSLGQLVRSYVSKVPLLRDQYGEFKVPTSNYIFEWDGKDSLGNTVASGVYLFKVAMHNVLNQNSQNGGDLKIVLVK